MTVCGYCCTVMKDAAKFHCNDLTNHGAQLLPGLPRRVHDLSWMRAFLGLFQHLFAQLGPFHSSLQLYSLNHWLFPFTAEVRHKMCACAMAHNALNNNMLGFAGIASLLIVTESTLGFSFWVRAQTEIYMLKVVSSEARTQALPKMNPLQGKSRIF